MSKFIVDSSIFITAKNLYYPFDIAPSFWEQMKTIIVQEDIILLDVVRDEIYRQEDSIKDWMKSISDLKFHSIKDEKMLDGYKTVLSYIQSSGLFKEKALRAWSDRYTADPWLISAAIEYNGIIITFEKDNSNPKDRSPKTKIKIPQVASAFGIECQDLNYLMREKHIVL